MNHTGPSQSGPSQPGLPQPGLSHTELSTLTGLRSGKRSYYRAYVASDERLKRSVQSMDSIALSAVRAGDGVDDLLEEVVRAAGVHLEACWVLLALADGHFESVTQRFLALDRTGELITQRCQVPDGVVGFLTEGQRRSTISGRRVRAAMTLNGTEVGTLVAVHGMDDDADPADLLVLRILANQAAIALHAFQQHCDGEALERRAERLHAEANERQRGLEQRTQELRRLEERLAIADQRELINGERRRIARELHDTVIHYVLSAGMSIEVARGEAADGSVAAGDFVESLTNAKLLCQEAVNQLRDAIYSLHLDTDNELTARLPDLIEKLAPNHSPNLPTTVEVEGVPVALPVQAHHEIVQAVGEALFNVTRHADATRALVGLRYAPDSLTITVDDDGVGEPDALGNTLQQNRRSTATRRHRGLVNIEDRITDLGGAIDFQSAPIGGLRVEMRLPLPLETPPLAVLGTLPTIPTADAAPEVDHREVDHLGAR